MRGAFAGSFALRALDDGVKQAKAKATTDADSSAAPQNDRGLRLGLPVRKTTTGVLRLRLRMTA